MLIPGSKLMLKKAARFLQSQKRVCSCAVPGLQHENQECKVNNAAKKTDLSV